MFKKLCLSLWFLFNPRLNRSPFTKDFRGEEHFLSLMTYFSSLDIRHGLKESMYVYFKNVSCCLSSLIPWLLFTFWHVFLYMYIVLLASLFIIVLCYYCTLCTNIGLRE